jgi:ribosomal protein L7/L12
MGIRDWFRSEPEDLNAELMREAEQARGPSDASPGWSDAPVDALTEAVRAEVAAGNKISAIKVYKDATGAGLKESKEAVEAIIAGKAVDPPPAPKLASVHTDADVEALLAKDEFIEAIKLYREIHGVGLKEAKDAVDAMRAAGGKA